MFHKILHFFIPFLNSRNFVVNSKSNTNFTWNLQSIINQSIHFELIILISNNYKFHQEFFYWIGKNHKFLFKFW